MCETCSSATAAAWSRRLEDSPPRRFPRSLFAPANTSPTSRSVGKSEHAPPHLNAVCQEAAMPKNSVAHFEIYADDPDALAKFYTSLFDWKIETVPGMDYRMVHTTDTDA